MKADLIWREQIAAQIVALMQADFKRPGPEEMKEILKCAEDQIGLPETKQPSPRVLLFQAKSK
jgi:hypothetical protein